MNTQPSVNHWHALPLAQVCEQLHADDQGLTEDEAAARLQAYGPNRLPEQPPPALWQIVLRQFINPLIYILVAAAVISVLVGEVKDAGFIAAVLMINAVVGSWQEWKAEQSSQALRKLLQIRATVQRNGELRELPAEQVVPGDTVWLESGNRTPADLRLLWTQGLEADESLLTGESLPVNKDAAWQGPEDATLGDRSNMAFAGSIVARGRGRGLVVATGTSTHIGQLALDVVATADGKPPLLERMERFTHVVAVVTVICSAFIGALAVTLGRYPLHDVFLFVIALAVSAIPEGLPVAMTVALAIGTTRMAQRGVIVRRLTAVEGLGSCTLIATDKTGTLTVNELTVREIRLPGGELCTITGEGFAPKGQILQDGNPIDPGLSPAVTALLQAGVFCNEAELKQRHGEWQWRGDAVDIALLALGEKGGLNRDRIVQQHPQVDAIPFESERQYAATFHRSGNAVRVYVKGAPERVLEMCDSDLDLRQMEAQALGMAERGFRVLALAEGEVADDERDNRNGGPPAHLRLLGFVGMIDPLRPGVREAVSTCHAAGMEVAMVTGDHRVTALAIARELGLSSEADEVLTGPELSGKSPEELAQLVKRVRVFARVAPRQKLEIVQAARAAGHFVAVTGDGVNDAPALRAANIGVAMGKSGTDVAREAAELVISDDNFRTIVAGVEEGRIAYDNIRKVIFLLLSAGAAELLIVLLTVASGLPVPLLPVQLLWLNMVTDGIQGVAIAFEPGEGDILRRRPRPPDEPIFNRLMIERMLVSVAGMGGIGFGAFAWLLHHGWSETEARNMLLLLMVLFENFHIGNCRSETKSAFALSPLRSPMLLLGALAALLVHVAGMTIPFLQDILETSFVSPQAWLGAVLLALAIVPVMEAHKLSWRLRYGQRIG